MIIPIPMRTAGKEDIQLKGGVILWKPESVCKHCFLSYKELCVGQVGVYSFLENREEMGRFSIPSICIEIEIDYSR